MPSILIVEDDARSRKLLADVLAVHGYRVFQADRGEAALELALACAPALFLLDIGLPGMDGVATLNTVRANPRLAAIPAIAVTASVMQMDRARLLASGFDAILYKPVRLQPLLDTVRAVLGRNSPPQAQ